MRTLQKIMHKEVPFFCSLPALLWQFLFVLAPVSIIIYFSFSSDEWLPSLMHYATLFQLTYFKIIFRSLMVATTTAIVCLLLAYPVAYYLAMHVQRAKELLLFLLTLPFWVNFLVQVYAWFFLLERNGLVNTILLKMRILSEPFLLSNSMFAIFLVMIYCYLPFMIMPLYSILEKIDHRLLEASGDLGASAWQTFWRITVPLSWPGIRTGFLLVLIPAFGEFVIPSLLGGAKYLLVGSLISYLFLVARNNSLGAAFTCLSGLVLIGAMLFTYRVRKTIKRVRRGI